jgi:hypothetical protein
MANRYNEATAPIAEIGDALMATYNVAGALRLARQVVIHEAGRNEDLAAAYNVLILAEREAARLYTWLGEEQLRNCREKHPAEEAGAHEEVSDA